MIRVPYSQAKVEKNSKQSYDGLVVPGLERAWQDVRRVDRELMYADKLELRKALEELEKK